MARSGLFAVSALVLLATPAVVAARCNQPYAPVVKVSTSTDKQALASLRGDVAAFISASDVYQKCLVSQGGSESMIDANQTEKERVGREFNALLRNFKGKS